MSPDLISRAPVARTPAPVHRSDNGSGNGGFCTCCGVPFPCSRATKGSAR